MTESIRQIGKIENYYGGLHLKNEGNRYFWAIENFDGLNHSYWEEIPDYLFKALNQFEEENMTPTISEFETLSNKMEAYVVSGKSITFTSTGIFLTPKVIWFTPKCVLYLIKFYNIQKPESYNELLNFLEENPLLARASNKTDFFNNPLYTTRKLYSERAGWKARIASVLTNKIIA